MTGSQQLVVTWIEYAAAGAILLLAARFTVSRLRQPADRIHLILMALLAAAVVPLLAHIARFPAWRLGVVAASASDDAMNFAQPPEARSVPESPPPTAAKSEPSRSSAEAAANRSPADRSDSLAPAAPSRRNAWELAAIVLATIYVAALLLFAAEGLLGVRWLQRLSAGAVPAETPIRRLWESVAAKRGQSVRLLVSSEVHSPLAFGCLRPTIVIPASMVAGDEAALRFCLAHEWSHIARGDLRTWRLTWACQLLLWFQPLFWVLRRELRVCQDLLLKNETSEKVGIKTKRLLAALDEEYLEKVLVGK